MLSEVFEEIKQNFNLKKNHLIILKLLSAEACTADEICERTTIPKGRVYNLLNELITLCLIDREKGTPAVYSMRKPDEHILNFLRHEFSKEVKKQTNIISMLKEKSKVERLDIISNNENYDYDLIAFLSEATWIKTIHRELSISWFIQPRNEEEFWHVREEINRRRRAATTPNKEISLLKFRTYMEFYKQKDIEQIMTKEAFDAYVDVIRDLYGPKKVKQWAKEMLTDLEKHKNVKLYILDTVSNVFNTYISDKGILSILVFRGEVSGIKIIGERVSNLYDLSFEEMKSKAIPIQKYLDSTT